MSAATQASDDATSDEASQFDYYPQVTQHPTTIIEGDIVDIVTGADLDSDVEDTGSSFGVVFEDPEVPNGTIWRNRNIPEGFVSTSEFNDTLRIAIEGTDLDYVRGVEVTEEAVSEARERVSDLVEEGIIETDELDLENLDYEAHRISGTDYKVADPSDQEASVQEVGGQTLGIDVGGGVFESEQADSFGENDRIMVWYGGMSGQRIGRALDFNGMPFARYTDPDDGEKPYLVKGLMQVPIGWRGDADVEQFGDVPTTDRGKLATDLGRPPRVARPPVLRDDIGRAFIAIGRLGGGQMHEAQVGLALEDYGDLADSLNSTDDTDESLFEAVEMAYSQDADEVLAEAFDNGEGVYAMYSGEGWQDEPADTQQTAATDTSGSSFDTPDIDAGVEHPTDEERQFAGDIAAKVEGTGADPREPIFGGQTLAEVVEASADEFEHEPDADAIEQVVFENVSHLSPDDR